MRAGKHVLVEKPAHLAFESTSSTRLVKQSLREVGQSSFSSTLLKTRELVDQSALGFDVYA